MFCEYARNATYFKGHALARLNQPHYTLPSGSIESFGSGHVAAVPRYLSISQGKGIYFAFPKHLRSIVHFIISGVGPWGIYRRQHITFIIKPVSLLNKDYPGHTFYKVPFFDFFGGVAAAAHGVLAAWHIRMPTLRTHHCSQQ